MSRPPVRRRRGGPPHAAPERGGARRVALAVMDRVRTTDAYANLVLPAEIARAKLDARDAAFATELTYGALRMQGTLDWVISLSSMRPPERIDPPVLDALRLGTYQILYTSVPAHAAVSETVGCVEQRSSQGFVNAILRKIADTREKIPWPQPSGDLATYLQIRHAHPRWMTAMWIEELGPDDAEALCRADNVFPGVSIRVNTARIEPDDLTAKLRDAGLDPAPGRYASDVLTVRSGGRPTEWPGFDEGLFAVQDEASVLVTRALGAVAGERVLDLCAGPGGKAAALARDGAEVVAVEPVPQRALLVARTAARLGGHVRVVQADGRTTPFAATFDAVLVDAPCSGLGVLRRRPEARWRVRRRDVRAAAILQRELMHAGFRCVRPGGRLVYAVCTVSAAETEQVVGAFLEEEEEAELAEGLPEVPRPHGAPTPTLQLLPHVHGTDGMFIALVRRKR